ncbi:serine hydrolase domain-containing protein [Flavobacterium cerinum]|uniref:Class A beta-lactamase-related serine hydrolase n=1 Tax=Flavobacterium cerinum TaxID=2502784 RepID=A0A444GKZ5_9FLAO|nr:serine hydrolase domain-containing protein [Flavobacterium cerinum]RWW91664.1 class A beta-lactamase-related serine hydrolase [Flavobacterium cerinum]
MKKLKLFITLIFITNFCLGQKRESYQLDSLFTVLYQQNQFNGQVLIAEKGNIILKKGYGISNENTKKSINEKTLFELASCSKQFTAAAIVLLKRDGKLNYNDKLSKYIPELNFWNDVTIYDLLRHTSGIPDFLGYMPDKWDHNKIATNDDVIKIFAVNKDTLQFTPKSRHRYSNTNYVLLASIIEKISGKKYADFLSEKIFKPLKMDRTFVYCRWKKPKKVDNLAIGYIWETNTFKKTTIVESEAEKDMVYYLDGIIGTSKVHSNVDDVYKWIQALKNNTLFTQKEFDEMTEITKTSEGKDIRYGFGLDVRKGVNSFTFGHTGSWDGYTTFVYHDMIRDRTIVVLENFNYGANPFNNMFQILEGQPLTIEYPKKIVLPESDITQYTGTYKSENGEHVLTYKEQHLIYNTPKDVWDVRFFPYTKNEFKGIRQGGADAVLKFTKTDDGRMKLEMLQNGKIIDFGIREN